MNAPVPATALTADAIPGLGLDDLELAIAKLEAAHGPEIDAAASQSHTTDAELPETSVESEAGGDVEATADLGAPNTLDLESELERELSAADIEAATEIDAAAAEAQDPREAPDLETVELELTLQQEDLARLTFEDSLKAALDRLDGELLFDVKLDNVDDCQRVAAVRLGDDSGRQFALVIMPQNGGSVRVEAAAGSANPLAAIAESYAGVMDALKIAA